MLLVLLILIPAFLPLMARRLVSQQQAAKYLGVTDRTVRNRISEGVITGFRIPGSRAIRVDLDEIDRLIKAIPTAMKPRQPFGPRARIVTVAQAVPVVVESAEGGNSK